MKKLIAAFEKLKKYQKVISIFLLWVSVVNFGRDHWDMGLLYGIAFLLYFDHVMYRVMVDPETRKKLAARRFKSGFSDPQDLGNPCGFNNPASPLYHMHNSPSISSTFESHRW